MKDIDFDELDRAVSSVLSKTTPADTSESAAVASPAEVTASHDNTPTKPVVSEPQSTSGPQSPLTDTGSGSPTPAPSLSTPEPTTAAASPIRLRSRGKFMDVMHPSADMNPDVTPGDRPAFTPPRTLAPLTTQGVEQPEPTAALDESNALIGAEPAPVSDIPETTAASIEEPEETLLLPAETEDEEPDASQETQQDANAGYVDPLDIAPKIAPEASDEVARPELAPQSTPFLSDTKVDKRPLGAFGDPDEQDDDQSKNTADDTQTAPVVPLPRELQPDVVQVESVQEPEQQPVASDKPFASTVSVADEDTDDGRVEGHPLFDTSTYHEPIAAVHAKKTAPWVFWVVGLGICLVIGAGVGYFLFTAGF